MSFLFGKSTKPKSPTEIVRHLREALALLERNKGNQRAMEKSVEDIARYTAMMKQILYGDPEHEPSPEACVQLAHELFNNDLIPKLITEMPLFEFESRKDVASIMNNLLRKDADGRFLLAEYITSNPQILVYLLDGYVSYESTDVALNCGSILRECIKHETLAKILIYSDNFYKFFQYVEVANFDTASDAFATFKDLLTCHKALSAEFLEKNYDQVFDHYTRLLNSENYVTRRQSLKLLGELLLDRTNFNIMTRYISNANNLKLMMNLLRDKAKSIAFESFHVFKVFVANPNKPKPVLDILVKNKSKLISFLTNFQNDRDDEQFKDEKAFLLKQIQQLG